MIEVGYEKIMPGIKSNLKGKKKLKGKDTLGIKPKTKQNRREDGSLTLIHEDRNNYFGKICHEMQSNKGVI